VIGDDPLARAGIAGLLAAEPGLAVTTQTGSSTPRPHDVVAWDMGADGASLERLRAWAGTAPAVAMVGDAETAGGALRAGARGVVPRASEPGRIAAALRAAAEGLLVMDPAYRAPVEPARPKDSAPDLLSPREIEVLALMSEGHPNKIIADRLGISEHTAKFHINTIFAKLDATTRTEAVVRAVRRGLLTL